MLIFLFLLLFIIKKNKKKVIDIRFIKDLNLSITIIDILIRETKGKSYLQVLNIVSDFRSDDFME